MLTLYAVCPTCGAAEPAPDGNYPPHWQSHTADSETRCFCSKVCLLDSLGIAVAPVHSRIAPTEHEIEMLRLLALGLINKQIGVQLGLAQPTIKNTLSRLFLKLGAHNRHEAALVGHARGIINLSSLAHQFASTMRRSTP